MNIETTLYHGISEEMIVLQNLETGEIERQVKLRKPVKNAETFENRLYVVYDGAKNKEIQSLDEWDVMGGVTGNTGNLLYKQMLAVGA